MSESESEMVVADAELKMDAESSVPKSEESENQSSDSRMESNSKKFMDMETLVKQNVLSDSTLSATSSGICSSVLNVEEYVSKIETVKKYATLKELDIGKKARSKRSLPPLEESEMNDESPFKKFRHEAGCKIAVSAPRRLFSKTPDDDSPHSSELNKKSVSAESRVSQLASLVESVKVNVETAKQNVEAAATYQAIKFSPAVSKQNVPKLRMQREEILAAMVDSLTSLYDRVYDYDQFTSEKPPLSIVSLGATENLFSEQVASPGTLSGLVKSEEVLFRVIDSLKCSTKEEENVAETFRQVVREVKDYMRKTGAKLCDFPLDKLNDSDEPVDIEEIRRALPMLWGAAKFNMLSLKQWTSSLLDWCLQAYPNASPQQFVNCEFGINELRNQVYSVRHTAASLMKRWRTHTMEYTEFYDLNYIMTVASTAVSMHTILENELCYLKFANFSTADN